MLEQPAVLNQRIQKFALELNCVWTDFLFLVLSMAKLKLPVCVVVNEQLLDLVVNGTEGNIRGLLRRTASRKAWQVGTYPYGNSTSMPLITYPFQTRLSRSIW